MRAASTAVTRTRGCAFFIGATRACDVGDVTYACGRAVTVKREQGQPPAHGGGVGRGVRGGAIPLPLAAGRPLIVVAQAAGATPAVSIVRCNE